MGKLWDIASGQELHTIWHAGTISSVTFSPDGKTLATGSYDGTVRLWDVETGQLISIPPGPASEVFDIAFLPSGRMLVAGYRDGTVATLDIRIDLGRHLPGQQNARTHSVAASPDGGTLAAGFGNGLIKLWDVVTRDELRSFPAPGPVFSLAFSPDSSILASGGMGEKVMLWDPASGQMIRSLERKGCCVWAVTFSSDGHTLAALGDYCCAVNLWNVDNGQVMYTLKGPNVSLIYGIAYSQDGKMVAAGDDEGTVWLWDIK